MTTIRSRAHRILKPLSRYRDLSEGAEWPIGLPSDVAFSASEQVLGVYSTDPVNFSDAILFTTKGLYLRQNGSWLRTLYSDIERLILPSSKNEIAGFSVLRRDGTEFWLPVRGSRAGRFYDAFELLRFIDRVKDSEIRN